MKQLLFVTLARDLDTSLDGVTRKMKAQMQSFGRKGYTVLFTYRKEKTIMLSDGKNTRVLCQTSLNSIIDQIKLYNALSQIIGKEIFPEVVYIRNYISDFAMLQFLKKCHKQNVQALLEIPTYPYKMERAKPRHIPVNLVDNLFKKAVAKQLDYIVTFTKDKHIRGAKCIQIDNGFDEQYTLLDFSKKDPNKLVLTSVSTCEEWHGIDRLLYSFAYYKKQNMQSNMNIQIHIIGDGRELHNLKKIVEENPQIAENVTFKGLLDMQSVMKIYKETDLAVSSLAIHRIGLESVQPLKNREYAACGIPFILAFNDPGFVNTPFTYRVKAEDAIFDFEEIIDWYKQMNISHQAIAEYAQQFSWDKQIATIVETLQMED